MSSFSFLFSPFSFGFNGFNNQRGGNPYVHPAEDPAEDVFAVIDLTEEGYTFGADCKEQ